MHSTTVGAIAATVPAGAEISSDRSTDAMAERWPQGAGAPPLPHVGVAPQRRGARPAELLVFTDAHVAASPGWLELLADATGSALGRGRRRAAGGCG